MTTVDAPAPVLAPSSENSAEAPPTPLPRLLTKLSGEEMRHRLDAAARKGRLPGLRLDSPESAFAIHEFGHPFESSLHAAVPDSQDGSGSAAREVVFRLRMRPLIPTIFAIVLVISIWPGIYIVDSMLRHYFSWYTIPTWWWYLPLTVPTSPWAFWSAVKKSRESARAEARGLIPKVAGELGAEVVE